MPTAGTSAYEVICEQALTGIEEMLLFFEEGVSGSAPSGPELRQERAVFRREMARLIVSRMDAEERRQGAGRLKQAIDVMRLALDTARRIREQIEKGPVEFRKILSELPFAAMETWPVLTTREDVEAFTLFRELWIQRLDQSSRDLLRHWLRHRKEKLVLHGIEGKAVSVGLV